PRRQADDDELVVEPGGGPASTTPRYAPSAVGFADYRPDSSVHGGDTAGSAVNSLPTMRRAAAYFAAASVMLPASVAGSPAMRLCLISSISSSLRLMARAACRSSVEKPAVRSRA